MKGEGNGVPPRAASSARGRRAYTHYNSQQPGRERRAPETPVTRGDGIAKGEEGEGGKADCKGTYRRTAEKP